MYRGPLNRDFGGLNQLDFDNDVLAGGGTVSI